MILNTFSPKDGTSREGNALTVELFEKFPVYFDDVPAEQVKDFLAGLLDTMTSKHATLMETISKEITKDAEVELKKALSDFRERKGFSAEPK